MGRCAAIAAVLVAVVAIIIGVATPLGLVHSFARLAWSSGALLAALLSHHDTTLDGIPAFYHLRSSGSLEWFRRILNEWRPRDEDVVLVNFPKAGTHFATQMLTQLMGGGDVEFEAQHHAAALGIEFQGLQPHLCNDSRVTTWYNAADQHPHRGVSFHTHLPPAFVMKPGRQKYVVLMRDPLDCLLAVQQFVSKLMNPLGPSLEEAYEHIFTKMVYGYGELFALWWKEHLRDPSRVSFFFYEDAVTDLAGFLSNLTTFLGRPLDAAAMERTRRRSTIQHMKSICERFEPPDCLSLLPGVKLWGGDMVNQGALKRGCAAASGELADRVRRYLRESLGETGIPLDRFTCMAS